MTAIGLCLFLSGDCFGQINHAPNADFKGLKAKMVLAATDMVPGIFSDLSIPVLDRQGMFDLPLLQRHLDSQRLSLPSAPALQSGFQLPLFGSQRLLMPSFLGSEFLGVSLVGSPAVAPPIDDLKESANSRFLSENSGWRR